MTTAPQGDRKGRPYILSDEFLNTLVAELDNDAVQAIILGGSYARGNAAPYSDLDFARFVKEIPGRAQIRAIAALRLYQESAKLLRPILHSTHREVIEHSLQVIDGADQFGLFRQL